MTSFEFVCLPNLEQGVSSAKSVKMAISYHYPEYPVGHNGPDKVSIICPNYDSHSNLCKLNFLRCHKLENLVMALELPDDFERRTK